MTRRPNVSISGPVWTRTPARARIGLAAALLLTFVTLAWQSSSSAFAAENEHAGGETSTTEHGAAASGEHEGEGGGHGEHGPPAIDAKTLGLQILNFAVLVFILVKFGGSAINKALAARHHQLKSDLASAAELRATAEAKLKTQEARLASLENEIAEMRRGIKAEAEAEKARLIAAAEERAARIKAETGFMVEQQIREAEVRLRRESADHALKVAEEILRRSIGTGDQQKLLDTFVSDVERDGGAAVVGTPTNGAQAGRVV